MKIRTRMFVCILGLLAVSLWSTSAFAQTSLSVSSVPRTTAIGTGHTEIAGDILVSAAVTGGLSSGSATLTIDYKVPITVPVANITICGAGSLAGSTALAGCGTNGYQAPGGILASGAPLTFSIGGVNQNQLLIVLPTLAAAAPVGTITISGVKVSLFGYVPTVLTSTLGVSAPTTFGSYSIGAGQNLTDVISLISPAFTTAVATGTTALPLAGQGTGQILSTATVSRRLFTIDVPESFVDAFKLTNGANGYLNDAGLTLTFSNVPNGVFLNLVGGVTGTSNTLCSLATGDLPQIYNSTSGGAVTNFPGIGSLSAPVIATSTSLTTTLSFTGGTFDLTQLNTIRLRGCIYTSGATAPLALGTISAAITLSPNGAALNTTATPPQIPISNLNFPRYQNAPVNLTVVNIVAAETDMLITFASRNTTGFDTGIAVSNTSTDPFGTSGATPNDGTCTLNLYPQGSGSAFTYTTAAGAPGLGLSATGVLVSGKTWTVGLSDLLGAITGAPTSFNGYIFVRCAFTNAHGAAYITDYKGFTSSTPFIIVGIGPRVIANENLNH